MSLLIKRVTLNDKLTDVFVDDGIIARIGENLKQKAKTVIDGSGKAIIPSFHNAHTHAAMSLMRGYADDLKLREWLTRHIWPFESRLTEEDVYNGTRLACLEMIKSGTTFFNDMYWHHRGTIRAVEEMGLRAAVSAVMIDNFDPDKATQQKTVNERLFEESAGYSERIQFSLGPHAIYTVSEESLRWCAQFAAVNNLRIHIHLSETETEVADCLKKHGMRPVEYLHHIGFLGANVTAAHVIHVTEKEIDILAKTRVSIAHCPTSNMKLCSGKFPYSAIAKKGIAIAIGTDGCASNNNLDMSEEMKIAALSEKFAQGDPSALGASEAFIHTTSTPAEIFGLNSGKIDEGKSADFILLDLNNVRLLPGHNLISDIVYSADSSCIDTTVCAGKILMLNRRVESEQEIVNAARETCNHIVATK